jgi:hypothetical protein
MFSPLGLDLSRAGWFMSAKVPDAGIPVNECGMRLP